MEPSKGDEETNKSTNKAKKKDQEGHRSLKSKSRRKRHLTLVWKPAPRLRTKPKKLETTLKPATFTETFQVAGGGPIICVRVLFPPSFSNNFPFFHLCVAGAESFLRKDLNREKKTQLVNQAVQKDSKGSYTFNLECQTVKMLSTKVSMGSKNTPSGTFEQIYESVKHYDVEVVNKGFQTGGYAVLKTTKLEHAWWWFDWLKIIGIYTGKRPGPCKAWRVSVSVSSVWFLVRVRYCKVPSCSWVLTIQESAGAIVVVQRPQHCAYDQAALEQLAEQLRQSLGVSPDEIPPSTPAQEHLVCPLFDLLNQRVPLDVLTMVSLMWMRPCELHCYPPGPHDRQHVHELPNDFGSWQELPQTKRPGDPADHDRRSVSMLSFIVRSDLPVFFCRTRASRTRWRARSPSQASIRLEICHVSTI